MPSFLEYLLHGIAKHPELCPLALESHDNGMLLAARILVFVADDDVMALGQRGDNHRIALQERRDDKRELRMSILPLTYPRGDVGRKSQTGAVSARDLRDDAVDGPDFNAGTSGPGAVREDGTGSMRMGQDEEPVGGAACEGDFASVVRALGRLPATGRRFHHHQRSLGP